LRQYVNDRPYVASSFLSVAIADVFASAMAGRSRDRAELAASEIPLEAHIAAVPCRGGEDMLRRLFEPLGYSVVATQATLEMSAPDAGASRYFSVTLTATRRVADLLTHLYVLIPVLDDEKHYWVGDDEVDKLLRHGERWLASHPERVAFEFAHPKLIVVTTPNAEYNVRWPSLPAGRFRHRDHRFEWTRAEFESWCSAVCARFGYTVRFSTVGPVDADVGAPTQMAIFTRAGTDV
jgi:hypothetical protein